MWKIDGPPKMIVVFEHVQQQSMAGEKCLRFFFVIWFILFRKGDKRRKRVVVQRNSIGSQMNLETVV